MARLLVELDACGGGLEMVRFFCVGGGLRLRRMGDEAEQRQRRKDNSNSKNNSRSLRDDNKRATATAKTTADPYGMTTKWQRQQQEQQQIPAG
jgi:hypothetical protein